MSDHWRPIEVAGYLGMIEAALAPVLVGPAHVLDLGCGLGRLTVPFAEQHPLAHVVGVDGSGRMLALAPRQHPRRVQFVHNDGRSLPDGPPLDGGWSVLMFQHVDDDTMAGYLQQVAARLRPGGLFLFQWVDETADAGPLSFPRHRVDVARMIDDAGLHLVAYLPHVIERGWGWATVQKDPA